LAGQRWLLCGAVALVRLCIGGIQLIIDASRGEIQKIRLVFRFAGAGASLVLGALGVMSPPYFIGLMASVGVFQILQELFL